MNVITKPVLVETAAQIWIPDTQEDYGAEALKDHDRARSSNRNLLSCLPSSIPYLLSVPSGLVVDLVTVTCTELQY